MNNKLRDLFQQPFDLVTYRSVILSQLLHAQRLLTSPEMLEQYDNGDQLYGLGYLTDNEGKEIGLYYTHVPNGDVRRKRVGFRKMLHPYVKYGVDAAVAVFDDGEHWRLSYICDLKGGVTSAKRFSYVFGDPKGQYNTPVSRLTDLAQKRLTIDELHKTFSVDALSKEFFDEYHRHYDRIIAELARQGNTGAVFHDYVKKMMGRIVFLHFLQKKGWLNDDPEFLSKLFFLSPYKQDFLEQELEPLFFGIFNTKPDKRKQLFQQENWDLRWLEEWKRLPYLNGGLFERDEVDKMKIKLSASLFENLFKFMASYNFTIDENDPDDADIGIDPEMLGKIFESLLEDNKAKGAFYTPKEIVRYMCKESLIAYLGTQATGLSKESGIQATGLSKERGGQATSLSKESGEQATSQSKESGEQATSLSKEPGEQSTILSDYIRKFVEQHEFPEELESYREVLDTALRNVKICDPAIGSGAFPMGLLNELWRCREALGERATSPSQMGTQATGLSQAGSLCSKEGQAGSLYPYSRAALKREIIENNIYGVDIEKGAIDIARLRFWLSIVVDAEKPEPLPNFDYKFMQGNSLIESFDGHDLSHILDKDRSSRPLSGRSARKAGWAENQTGMEFGSDEVKQNLRNWLKMYFSLTDHKEKAYYRELINSSVKNYIVQQGIGPAAETRLNAIDPSANQDFFLWHTWFKDIFDKGGFDIIIANPPYVKEYTNREAFDGFRETSPYYIGKMDIWYGFACHGIDFLQPSGLLCFIAQNNWTTSAGAKKMRNKVTKDAQILQLLDFNTYMVFDNADIQTMIMLFQRNQNTDNYSFDYRIITQGNEKEDMLALLTKQQRNTKYLEPTINRKTYYDRLFTFTDNSHIFEKLAKNKVFLNDDEVAQGIVFPQDYLNKQGAKKLSNRYPIGTGIFGLDQTEKDLMTLNKNELKLIKPYFTTEQIHRYYTDPHNTQWLIYTDSSFKKKEKMNAYPNIKEHLDKFISIFTSDNKPYGLHRCRKQSFFQGEKIISLRKCVDKPCFSYSDFDCYVTQTFFSIKTTRWNMKFLTGVLNSKPITFWLRNKGKMQGDNYQVDKEPLLGIPLPLVNTSQQQTIISLVNQILEAKCSNPTADTSALEHEIDQQVYALYNLTPEEIAIIEQ